jgi:hypothetical protein
VNIAVSSVNLRVNYQNLGWLWEPTKLTKGVRKEGGLLWILCPLKIHSLFCFTPRIYEICVLSYVLLYTVTKMLPHS